MPAFFDLGECYELNTAPENSLSLNRVGKNITEYPFDMNWQINRCSRLSETGFPYQRCAESGWGDCRHFNRKLGIGMDGSLSNGRINLRRND